MTIAEILNALGIAAVSFGLLVLGLIALWTMLWLTGCWADDDRNPFDLDLDEERYTVRNPITVIVPLDVCDCGRCRPEEEGQWVPVRRFDEQVIHAGGGER